MELISLYLFTLLGGLAAGTYVFETCFSRKREESRPWLIPLVVVILFAIGTIAAATHVQSIPRAFDALFGGTVNFGAGMTQEVVIAVCFLVLAVVDLVVVAVRKSSPYALRVITAVVAVVCMVMMGTAYTDVYGNAIWCNAPATIVSFVAGDLAMGLALYALLGQAGYAEAGLRITSLCVSVVLAVGIGLEIAAFAGEGADAMMQVAALVIAPVASIVLVALSSKFKNERALAVAVLAVMVIGVAVSRWAFYACGAVL